MKVFLFLIGIAAAGLLGYSFEPSMRYSLTGKESLKGKDSEPTIVIAEPEAKPRNIDPSKFPQERLPKKVTLKGDVEFSDKKSELTMKVTAGSKVNLVRVEGFNVVINPGVGNFEGSVPIAATDLRELLAALPDGPMESEPETETKTEPKTEPTAEPEPETMPEPEVMPEPEPEPEPEVPAGPVDVVAVMKSSIQAGEIKEFSFDQVMDWEAVEEEETFDGESYKIGLLTYKAETFVGVRTIQAKALVKGNKVARWLWPKSGMEIK
ncbi:MAG: hypothetical protein NWT08_03515 [Akkermansiaceae bacterium]|jgi:hypothetical protein|nr:hypothetical protein [Akkermansiaceae bacterium]MDP4647880.1 hypothetical protein [Akkermansiaceae bacterium]MDP4722014.1 hypothetical protein [Akkermansiaceae bacterium]MDP4780674.1 hypothetical protein [Akkermansiaceae bacterium]MDP4846103.1 hypothetical protein [Akkermansiaceae bacterium]